jgi:hypothetical protein
MGPINVGHGCRTDLSHSCIAIRLVIPKVRSALYLRRLPSLVNTWNSGGVAIVERANRALREEAQRLLRVGRCNVEIYSTKAEIRRRTIASAHSFDPKFGDSGLIISRIYRSPHTGISRVPWTNLSILPSITSWTRETGKTPLFASESLVKSDGRGLSDFATGPSPFPDTPWQEAQD